MNLDDEWNLWYHHDKDNWKISGYKKIHNIKTIEDFWQLFTVFPLLGMNTRHFFFMKNDILPIYEDERNKHGGVFSFKVYEHQVEELWEDLGVYIVSGHLVTDNEAVGLSISIKKGGHYIIKIWVGNSNNTSIKIINENILKKWGLDIYYVAHLVNQ